MQKSLINPTHNNPPSEKHSTPMRSGRSFRVVLCTLLLALAFLASAKQGVDGKETQALTQHWYVVLFDGLKSGSLLIERRVDGNRITNSETIDLELGRGDSKIALYTEQHFVENLQQQPVALRYLARMSGMENTLDATIAPDGTMAVHETIAGQSKSRTLKLERGVLFPEAQLAKLKSSGFKPGAKVEFVAFDPSSLENIRLETTFVAERTVDLLDRSERLMEVNQVMHVGGTSFDVKSFVDTQFNARKTQLSMMGLQLEILAATKAMAKAANQSGDEFLRMMMRAPRRLTQAELSHGLRYDMRYQGEGLMPETGEQRVRAVKDGFTLDVCARCGTEAAPSPDELARHRAPSRFLQSAHPDIRAAAIAVRDKLSASDRKNTRKLMLALQEFVAGHIEKKNLEIGYASALEVLRDRAGDCTEHALLLAALGRSLDIPTRVVGGYAYAEDYLDQANVFVPHAWTQAFVDGRWQSFDAALDGFTAGHIAIEYGDGDPGKFFGGIHLHGNITIASVSKLQDAR
jgi:hypothetical protein